MLLGRPVKLLNLGRAAHTRAKKITVQATQDFGRRFQGELFSVAEGHMRLKLHPEGLAAYVVKNEPLKFPELKASEAVRRRQEMAARAKAEQQEEAARVLAGAKLEETVEEKQKKKVQSLLDSLSFPDAGAPAPVQTVSTSPNANATPNAANHPEPSSSNPQTAPNQPGKQFEWQNKFVVGITKK